MHTYIHVHTTYTKYSRRVDTHTRLGHRCTDIKAHTQTHKNESRQSWHACTHMHMHAHACTHTKVCQDSVSWHKYTHFYITYMCAHMRQTLTHMHTHAHTCTHMHTHAHACAHIHTHARAHNDNKDKSSQRWQRRQEQTKIQERQWQQQRKNSKHGKSSQWLNFSLTHLRIHAHTRAQRVDTQPIAHNGNFKTARAALNDWHWRAVNDDNDDKSRQ